jgi:DNA-binding NarL/FixJ family response regulator
VRYGRIGETLGIARQTVKNRMKAVLDKTGASDLHELTLQALAGRIRGD